MSRTTSSSTRRVAPRRAAFLVLLFVVAVAGVASARADATSPPTTSPAGTGATPAPSGPSDEALRAGAQVYSQICSACHQPGGVGLGTSFPPLLDNPNVQDAAYVTDVIKNGRSGEITVLGRTFNGQMPPQTALSDTDIANVIAYLQSGFQAPSGGEVGTTTGPVAGTKLPALANMTWILGFLIVAGVFVLVFAPRIVSAHDGRSMPWLDAWLKSALIVLGFILFTVVVPSRVLETEAVGKLDRPLQDLVASGLWFGGLAGGLWALWYAQRDRRI